MDRLALIWIFLNKGQQQPQSLLSTLPFEIIRHLMYFVCNSSEFLPTSFLYFITDTSSNEQFSKKQAFEKIYLTMAKGDGTLLSNHDFLDKHKQLSPVRFIRKIQDKVQTEPYSLTSQSWKLACKHHTQCTSENIALIRTLERWYIRKDGMKNKINNFISFFNHNEKKEDQTIQSQIKKILG